MLSIEDIREYLVLFKNTSFGGFLLFSSILFLKFGPTIIKDWLSVVPAFFEAKETIKNKASKNGSNLDQE